MIIAIPVTRNYKPFEVSEKCAKSAYFLIVDTDQSVFQYVLNPFFELTVDQGVEVVEFLVQLNVNRLVALEFSISVQLAARKYKIELIRLKNNSINVPQIMGMLGMQNGSETITQNIVDLKY